MDAESGNPAQHSVTMQSGFTPATDLPERRSLLEPRPGSEDIKFSIRRILEGSSVSVPPRDLYPDALRVKYESQPVNHAAMYADIVRASGGDQDTDDVSDIDDDDDGEVLDDEDEKRKNDVDMKEMSQMDEATDDSYQRLAWLQCTRYKPPKLPRSNKSKEKSKKRKLGRNPRIPFTQHQVTLLEQKFRATHYLSSVDVAELSSNLNLTENRVKIWFQNRRARERREKEVRMTSYNDVTETSNASDVRAPSNQDVNSVICHHFDLTCRHGRDEEQNMLSTGDVTSSCDSYDLPTSCKMTTRVQGHQLQQLPPFTSNSSSSCLQQRLSCCTMMLPPSLAALRMTSLWPPSLSCGQFRPTSLRVSAADLHTAAPDFLAQLTSAAAAVAKARRYSTFAPSVGMLR